MANIRIENVDIGSVLHKDAQFRDEILAVTGADTIAEGTILARKSVATAVVAAAGTNTGDGTVTAATVVAGSIVPIVGAHVLTCTAVATHGGVFKLVDPNGSVVATGLTMTASTGAATVFEVGGLQFTVTDGDTDFAVGDSFTLTVAADGDLVIFDVDGTAGAQIPCAVLTYDVVTTATADVPIRAAVSGTFRKERLIIDAGGTVTNAILDQLRDYGIVAVDVKELNILDNQ